MAAYRHCKIDFDEAVVFPERVEDGMVVVHGPRATLYIWNGEDRKFDQIDRLEGVTQKTTGDGFILEGRSQNLRNDPNLRLKPAETKTTVHVSGWRGCTSC
jgi:hypothetical protein